MYFKIKDENISDKYMVIWEKVSNVIKKINSELIYNKKYLKAEKRFDKKDGFQCFYMPVILFDSVYIKYGNYYPKVFLQKFIQNFFWKSIINFSFWGFGSSSWNIRSFLNQEQESSVWRYTFLYNTYFITFEAFSIKEL